MVQRRTGQHAEVLRQWGTKGDDRNIKCIKRLLTVAITDGGMDGQSSL